MLCSYTLIRPPIFSFSFFLVFSFHFISFFISCAYFCVRSTPINLTKPSVLFTRKKEKQRKCLRFCSVRFCFFLSFRFVFYALVIVSSVFSFWKKYFFFFGFYNFLSGCIRCFPCDLFILCFYFVGNVIISLVICFSLHSQETLFLDE